MNINCTKETLVFKIDIKLQVLNVGFRPIVVNVDNDKYLSPLEL